MATSSFVIVFFLNGGYVNIYCSLHYIYIVRSIELNRKMRFMQKSNETSKNE